MKCSLLILSFIIAVSTFAQTPKVDTLIHETWNGTAWIISSRNISSYDGSCRLSSVLAQRWSAGSWIDSSMMTYTYGGSKVSQVITMTWNGSSWQNTLRDSYTYDGSLRLVTEMHDSSINNTWKLYLQKKYTYNLAGLNDSILYQKPSADTLRYSALYINSYNADGTLATQEHKRWRRNRKVWISKELTTYTYNADKTLSQSVNMMLVSGVWQNDTRFTYTYSSGKAISTLKQNWDGAAWINRYYLSNSYDGDGNLISVLRKQWSVDNKWYNNTRDNYTYTECVLPLTLVSFTAERNGNIVTLKWKTAGEINTSHFLAQRSINSINFTNIGNVAATGNSSIAQYYSFTDNVEKISSNKIYYRLQMFDKDGKFTYSNIILLTLEPYAGNIKTYPNPVKDIIYVLFNMQNASKAELRVTDATGKVVYSQHIITAPNNNALSINAAAFSKGVYYVQVITDKNVQKTQFIKQ